MDSRADSQRSATGTATVTSPGKYNVPFCIILSFLPPINVLFTFLFQNLIVWGIHIRWRLLGDIRGIMCSLGHSTFGYLGTQVSFSGGQEWVWLKSGLARVRAACRTWSGHWVSDRGVPGRALLSTFQLSQPPPAPTTGKAKPSCGGRSVSLLIQRWEVGERSRVSACS